MHMYGQKALLSHGDALCTDDTQYQRVRLMTRNPDWQASILAKPLKERLRIAAEARRQSLERTLNMSMDIMDVNQDEVAAHNHESTASTCCCMAIRTAPTSIRIDLGNRKAKRIVLGDWYTQGSVLRWDLRGPKLREMPAPERVAQPRVQPE